MDFKLIFIILHDVHLILNILFVNGFKIDLLYTKILQSSVVISKVVRIVLLRFRQNHLVASCDHNQNENENSS